MSSPRNAVLKSLPSVDALLRRPEMVAMAEEFGRERVKEGIRELLGELRSERLAGVPEAAVDAARLRRRLSARTGPRLVRVLNATGVVLHTNLGRAPLSEAALARVVEVGRGFTNLEFDLDKGVRGKRMRPVEEGLKELFDCQAALVVNNCAAAVLLALSALARGKEVIVSRGEAVEIGGGFRIPEVMAQSGATLIEVGTVNKTRVDDYLAPISERTALVMRIHRSNFAVVGFTEEPSMADLVAGASMRGVDLFHDLGSGYASPEMAIPDTTVQESLRAGSALVAFSGDKLFGGPQCGILVGRQELIAQLERHPLVRALRVDKLTLAALEATVEAHLAGRLHTIPALAMMARPVAELAKQGRALAARLGEKGIPCELLESEVQVGAGSTPLHRIPSAALVFKAHPESMAAALRRGTPPVVGRIHAGALWLDLRCLAEGELRELEEAVAAAYLLATPVEGRG